MQIIYRAASCTPAVEIALTLGVSTQAVVQSAGAVFLREGEYLAIRRGNTPYGRVTLEELSLLKRNKAQYLNACRRACVPFIYLGMPVEGGE